MSRLLVADTIQVDTTHGSSKIELCLGSVTKTIEPVDVLVISAYPGLILLKLVFESSLVFYYCCISWQAAEQSQSCPMMEVGESVVCHN